MNNIRLWHAWYPEDYWRDTTNLCLEEDALYRRMLDLAWLQPDCMLPADMKHLYSMLQRCGDVHGRTLNTYVPGLLKRYFIQYIDGRWFQKRLLFEYQKALQISRNQSERASKRWQNDTEKTGNPLIFNSRGHADAMPIPYKERDLTSFFPTAENKKGPSEEESQEAFEAMGRPITPKEYWEELDKRSGKEKARKNLTKDEQDALDRETLKHYYDKAHKPLNGGPH